MSASMRNVIACNHRECSSAVSGQHQETVTDLRMRAVADLSWRSHVSIPEDYCPDHNWRAPHPGELWWLSIAAPLTLRSDYFLYRYQRWVFDGIWRFVPVEGGSPVDVDDPRIYDARAQAEGVAE